MTAEDKYTPQAERWSEDAYADSAVYLAHLKPSGRRTMHQALNVIAARLTGGKADALTCPWAALRFQHTNAIRAYFPRWQIVSKHHDHVDPMQILLFLRPA